MNDDPEDWIDWLFFCGLMVFTLIVAAVWLPILALGRAVRGAVDGRSLG
jgi:hypothetical protein